MDWFIKHGDTLAVIATFAMCFWHLNEKINTLEKDVAIIKTVLVLKNIYPHELAVTSEEK